MQITGLEVIQIYKLLKLVRTAAHSGFMKLLRWPLVSDK